MFNKTKEIKLLLPIFVPKKARISHVLVLFSSFLLLLIIFNPFGKMTMSETGIIETVISSGIVSLLYCTIASATMWAYSKKITNNKFKVIDYLIMIVINTLLSSIIFAIGSVNIYDYFESFAFVGAIIIIPYIITTFYSYTRYLVKELIDKRRILEMTKDKEAKKEMIGFTDEYGKIDFYLDRESILYIEANDNYVNIYFKSNSKTSHKILRSTLKSIELVLEKYNMIKCHRSYIVNLEHVLITHKDKGKLKIELRNCDFLIPVSTSFAPKIMEYIANSPLER